MKGALVEMNGEEKEYVMYPEYVEMFRGFIDAVNALPHVKIYTDRVFYKRGETKEIKSGDDSKTGKLLFEFETDDRRTIYAFETTKNIRSTKNRTSLQYGSDGVTGVTVDLRDNSRMDMPKEVVEALRLSTSRCFNQTAYGAMFTNGMKYQQNYCDDDTKEFLDALLFDPSINMDAKGRADYLVSTFYDKDVADIGLELGYKQYVFDTIKKGETEGALKPFVSLDDMDAAYERAGYPEGFLMSVYGLDTMYDYLKRINDHLEEHPNVVPDMSLALFSGAGNDLSIENIALNQAVNALAVYKAVLKDVVKSEIKIKDSVYYMLESTNVDRDTKGKKLKTETNKYKEHCKVHCYPKNIRTSKPEDTTLSPSESYLLFRSVSLGKKIDEPLHIPAAFISLYMRDDEKVPTNKNLRITVAEKNGRYTERTEFTLEEFFDGMAPIDLERKKIRDAVIEQFPAIAYFQNESEAIGNYLISKMKSKNTQGYDLMDLETDIFTNGLDNRRIDTLTSDEYKAAEAEIIAKLDKHYKKIYDTGTGECVGSYKTYVVSCDNEYGIPDRNTGVMCFGDLITTVIENQPQKEMVKDDGYLSAARDIQMTLSRNPITKNMRELDYQMQAIKLEGKALGLGDDCSYTSVFVNSPLFDNVKTHLLTTREFCNLDASTEHTNIKKGIALNDLIIMTHAYCAYDTDSIKVIREDIKNALADDVSEGHLYRPQSKTEADLMRYMFEHKEESGISLDMIRVESQKPVSTFNAIMRECISNMPEKSRDAMRARMVTSACVSDTISNKTCGNMINIINEVCAEESMRPDATQQEIESTLVNYDKMIAEGQKNQGTETVDPNDPTYA